DNIAYMKRQLESLGFAIDWSRELATCRPEYYRWNQWFFLRMLERGIAYKKTQVVNWDPVDQTVLANEQVIDGRGWRTGALVEKREIPGYYLAITKYADDLLGALDRLPGWPERVRTMQANWIGKSHGVRFAFPYTLDGLAQKLWVYTTRADTIMGVTFCAVAAEHPLATRAARDDAALAAFVDECKRGSVMEADIATMEKKGMPTGLFVEHPLTGAAIEVWIGNYVLMTYGDGAVMGVPAHDERDFAFARKYGLAIAPVIEVPGTTFSPERWQDGYADKERGVCVNSGPYDGLGYERAVDAIAADLKAKALGDKQVQWRLRDWGVSRQRYWGCPIPIVHCAQCGSVPVPDDQLPVVLPEDCVPDGTGNPLARRADFVDTPCPQCGGKAARETDTMDTFVDSSWYYARFATPGSDTQMVDARVGHWMPVDQYIGGIEHAILHLLYSRFWTKAMRDLGLVEYDEPFANLLTQGMVLNHIFTRRTERGGIAYFAPDEVDVATDAAGKVTGATARADGLAVSYDGIGTMSKSKRNGVDPQLLIEHYGADTARFYMMFASPPEQTLEWSDSSVEGAFRFLRRVWAFGHRFATEMQPHLASGRPSASTLAELPEALAGMRRDVHLILKQANYDFGKFQFNTVASAAMKMLNAIEKPPEGDAGLVAAVTEEALSILIRLLAPIVPHLAHGLWGELGFTSTFGSALLDAPWPEPSDAALAQAEIELVLQVNGKLRGSVRVPAAADKDQIERLALASDSARKALDGRPPRRVVVVPGRLVNIVL
ncbi:MAG: leucine--tRNA ligase, partial [Proteobacteria bacterium]|nr:leucine--tRNA ligase [Burkholderiales bacterium]